MGVEGGGEGREKGWKGEIASILGQREMESEEIGLRIAPDRAGRAPPDLSPFRAIGNYVLFLHHLWEEKRGGARVVAKTKGASCCFSQPPSNARNRWGR